MIGLFTFLTLLAVCGAESPPETPVLAVAPTLAEAPKYELRVPGSGAFPGEPGVIAVAQEGDRLAIRAELTDRMIWAAGERDQMSHFKWGDTLEVFLKPDDRECYWELYVTPRGKVSCFFRRFSGDAPGAAESPLRLEAKPAILTGKDGRQIGWQVELRFPVDDLTAAGGPFSLDGRWTILVGRYNHLDRIDPDTAELSSYPALPVPRFHLHASYAALRSGKSDR